MWQEIREWFRPTERAGTRTSAKTARIEPERGIVAQSPRRETSRPDSWGGRVPALDRLHEEATGFGAVAGVADQPDEAELLDFLASDLDPVPADPAFRERLRDDLWEMLEDARVERSKD